ncbi:hypothetical protein CEY00_Acc21981 [Actinidia chinensis var. chinensis]|uniref:Uncharacterized protein n=1 Tax=Actinidia chinensis var. chinensis TaxID=1590841 RepID=A0A2R6PS17_ACTCC|nr:hypothetical protein CEY00_Acc21981 [Actinidia chinensis var. chinensis]
MEANNFGAMKWSDQLDNGPAPAHVEPNEIGGGGGGGVKAKYGKKIGEGLGKTKAVASSGVRKVKEGSSAGVQWIKEKYHKTTHKR